MNQRGASRHRISPPNLGPPLLMRYGSGTLPANADNLTLISDLLTSPTCVQTRLVIHLLQWHLDQLQNQNDASHSSVRHLELLDMLQLCKHTHANINRLMVLRNIALRNNPDRRRSRVITPAPVPTASNRRAAGMGPRPRTRRKLLQCSVCATTTTPQWRTGPAGKRSLCNVCGLLYAKRRARALLEDTPPIRLYKEALIKEAAVDGNTCNRGSRPVSFAGLCF
ncbi:hypothetical protein PWT90_08344 [Aphanocladium album]|nr:hypothetical protein PWT90_08344 [Aphanocladium album]